MGLQTVSAELTSMRGMDTIISKRFDRTTDGHPIGFASARALLLRTMIIIPILKLLTY